jgi:microcompartment protein CcmK/EutM
MMLARVVGRIWATAKNESLEGRKLLVLQPVDPALQAKGKRLVAVDAAGAGAGEVVYYCRGREASFPWLPSETPTDATIVGIVDKVNLT